MNDVAGQASPDVGDTARGTRDALSDFTRDQSMIALSGMAAIVGVVATFAAWALLWLIQAITNLTFFHTLSAAALSPAGHHLGIWVIVTPAMGGLIIGLIARFGSEQVRGHGIPEAIEAILFGRSRMKARVAVMKPIASAISIGTGGPFGAEGPIIMTGGAFGSLFARAFHVTSAQRKVLLVAGAAAGMSAVFGTPVAAVLLAVELLLFEWKPRSFIPVAVASGVAAAVRVPLIGPGPMFAMPAHAAVGAQGLASALAIGLSAGVASSLLTLLVYAAEDAFHRLRLHWMWWPALGGLVVGVGGWFDPRVLGVGYGTLHALLLGKLAPGAVVALMLLKALVWAVALGSGTSGGVLAPLLIMGACLGAIEGHWLPGGDAGLWAVVGMAAMMGGTMRSPLTAMLFAVELTRDASLLPALLAGAVAAHAVTVLLMRRSILTEKVARRGLHLSREYVVDASDLVRVGEVMDAHPPTVRSDESVRKLAEKIVAGAPELGRHGMAVLDATGKLVGIVTRSDVLRAMSQHEDELNVGDIASEQPITIHADALVRDAIALMLRKGIGRLLVVSQQDDTRLVGYLGRRELISSRSRQWQEENDRERIWNGRTRRADVGAPASGAVE